MKTTILLLLLASVAANAADERFIYTTNQVPASGTWVITADGVVSPIGGNLWMFSQGEVKSKTASGSVVQLFTEEDVIVIRELPRKKIDPATRIGAYRSGTKPGEGLVLDPAFTRVKVGTKRIDGDRVFVLHSDSGIGVQKTFALYSLGSITNGGTVYSLYDAGIVTNVLRTVVTTNWNTDYVNRVRNENAISTQARVIAYQFAQASNGLPSFQTEVAKRYLNGDGLEKNMTLARHWLNSACTNRDSQASNLLLRLPSE